MYNLKSTLEKIKNGFAAEHLNKILPDESKVDVKLALDKVATVDHSQEKDLHDQKR